MDIFRVHQELIDDYRSFTTSAIAPLDPRISQYVQDELAEGKQWPQPWLSLNPMFASWRLDRRVGHREAAAPGMLEDLSTEARPGRRRYPPRRIVEQVEIAALEYVDWFNHHRLYQVCGDITAAELEQAHYRQQAALTEAGHSTA
jgi:hypothetical protein